MNVFNQQINNMIDLIFPDTKNDITAGTTDNTTMGRLIHQHKIRYPIIYLTTLPYSQHADNFSLTFLIK